MGDMAPFHGTPAPPPGTVPAVVPNGMTVEQAAAAEKAREAIAASGNPSNWASMWGASVAVGLSTVDVAVRAAIAAYDADVEAAKAKRDAAIAAALK